MLDGKIIGKRIQDKRKAINCTQSELAEMLDISVSYMALLERGGRLPSLEKVLKLSKILGVSADYLLTGADSPVDSFNFKTQYKLLISRMTQQLDVLSNIVLDSIELLPEEEKDRITIQDIDMGDSSNTPIVYRKNKAKQEPLRFD